MRCFHGVDSDSNSLGGTILKSGGNKPPFLMKTGIKFSTAIIVKTMTQSR